MVLWLDTHKKLEEGSRSDPEPSLTKFLIESLLEIEESDPEVLQSIYLTSFIRKSLLEVEEIDPGELQSSSRWISNYIRVGNPESLVWCRSEVGKSLILWFSFGFLKVLWFFYCFPLFFFVSLHKRLKTSKKT